MNYYFVYIYNVTCMVNILGYRSNINQIEKYQKQSILLFILCKNEEDNIIEVLNDLCLNLIRKNRNINW